MSTVSMERLSFGLSCLLAFAAACGSSEDSDVYDLASENGDPVPADPSAPDGCCITLSGFLKLGETEYELHGSYRNKVNGMEFVNTELGVYSREGDELTFTRRSGSGLGQPFLLDVGSISDDESTITLSYGDEGPGSDQIEAVYKRQ